MAMIFETPTDFDSTPTVYADGGDVFNARPCTAGVEFTVGPMAVRLTAAEVACLMRQLPAWIISRATQSDADYAALLRITERLGGKTATDN